MTYSIYDKYEIEEMYSQLVEEIIKAIHEEYEVEEVINEFEDEDFEDILSSYDYDKWIVAMYFLDDPEDIEEEGWDSILEQFVDDIRESFIDKYEDETDSSTNDMSWSKSSSSIKNTFKINCEYSPKEYKNHLNTIKTEVNKAYHSNDLERVNKFMRKLDELIDDIIESYTSDRDNWPHDSVNFAELKVYYNRNFVEVLEDYVYDFDDKQNQKQVMALVDLMKKEISNY